MVKRSIKGKVEEFEEKDMDIFKLKYYPENPRVHHILTGMNTKDQDKIEEIMWSKDSTKDLFWDIKKDGLMEPILVSEKNYVMEGNTRLCVFRHLYKQAKEENKKEDMEKWRYIRCEIYPPGLDEFGIHKMLGKWHIKRKKEWDSFEKASYIKRLMDHFKMNVDEIAEELSMKKSEIEKMLWSENIMTEEKVENIKLYSHFEQIHQQPELRKKVNENPEFKKKIVKAVSSGLVGEARNIRDLGKIIKKDESAIDLLVQGENLETVKRMVDEENPDDNPILKTMEKLVKQLDKLDVTEFLQEINQEKDKKKIVEKFLKKVSTFEDLVIKKIKIN